MMSVSKCSKKMISKELYLRLVGASHPAVKDEFMRRGGWQLIFGWTRNAIADKNYSLLKAILDLLMITPVSTARLKSNGFIPTFKEFLQECRNEDMKKLCKSVLSCWRQLGRAEQSGMTYIFWEHQPQLGTPPSKGGQDIGGEASINAGGAAAPSSPADGGEGGRINLSVNCIQNNLVERKEEGKEVVTPEDNHPMASKAFEGPPPFQAPEFKASKVPQLGAQDNDGAAGGQVKRLEKESKVVVSVKKVSVEIPKKCSKMLSTKKNEKDDQSCYSDHSSSLPPPRKKIKSSSSSGSGNPTCIAKVNTAVPSKEGKNRKKKTEKKKREKVQSDQDKEAKTKLIWMPPPASSSSGWKIPRKASPNLGNGIPDSTPSKVKTKQRDTNEAEENPGATKKAELEREKTVGMMMIPKQSLQIPKFRKELKKQAVAVERNSGGGRQVVRKALKSCLAVKRLTTNRPKKTVSWKTPLQEFDEDSAKIDSERKSQDSRKGDSRRTNGCRMNKNNPDLNRIGTNGLMRKKKRCEILCRYFKKGNCGYGTRCNFLHSAASVSASSISTPANQKPVPAPQPTYHRNGNSGNRNN